MAILLRRLREERGYSVRELAERAGVGFVTVSRIENGRMNPSVATLEKLAKGLGVHITEMFAPPRRTRR